MWPLKSVKFILNHPLLYRVWLLPDQQDIFQGLCMQLSFNHPGFIIVLYFKYKIDLPDQHNLPKGCVYNCFSITPFAAFFDFVVNNRS